MEDGKKFPAPIGAIWQHSDKSAFVKINCYKEKYIAIKNSKKSRDSEPSFFLHVYKTHTGAAPASFFRDFGARGRDSEKVESVKKPDCLCSDIKRDDVEATGLQVGEQNLQSDANDDKTSAQEPLGNKGETGTVQNTDND